jgi:hypothetical protein
MTAVQWIKTLEKQHRDYNKSVFTTTEMASLSGQSRHFLLVQLSRLVKKGVLIRYKRGLYGEKEQPVEELIPYLDSSAYCTGHYALQNVIIAETGSFPRDQTPLNFLNQRQLFIPARNQKWLCLNRRFVIMSIIAVTEG